MARSLLIGKAAFAIVLAVLAAGCERAEVELGEPNSLTAVRIPPDGTDAAEPAIAADAAGNIFVVYVEHSGKTADVFVQRVNPSGKAPGVTVRVNPVIGEAKAWKGDPPTIAVAADNTIYVGWTRVLADGTKGNDLVLSASTDGGRTFGEPVKINDDAKPVSHGMHSLAIGKDNRIYAAWLDERNVVVKPHATQAVVHHEEVEPNSEVFYSISTDGGKTFVANKKIAIDACPCCKTSLLAAADGSVYIAWRQVMEGDYRHVAVAHSNDAGETFSEGVIASDDKWQLNACPVSGAALMSGGDGSLDVVWYTAGSSGQAGTYFARSTDGGKSFAPRVLVSNEAKPGTPVLIKAEETYAVFDAADNNIVVASWSGTPVSQIRRPKITDAGLPAAVFVKGKIVTAFVRNTGGKRSVWLASN